MNGWSLPQRFWMAGPNSSYTSYKLLAKKRDPWIWGQRSKFRKFRSTTTTPTVDPEVSMQEIPIWPVSRPGLSSTEWSKPRSPCCGSDPTVAVPCRSYTWRWWMLWIGVFCWWPRGELVSFWLWFCDLQIKGSKSVTAWINWKWSILLEGSFWILERFPKKKLHTHPFLILTQREKRLDSCTPKHTAPKVLFLRKPEVIEIPHHPYMICSRIITINSLWS